MFFLTRSELLEFLNGKIWSVYIKTEDGKITEIDKDDFLEQEIEGVGDILKFERKVVCFYERENPLIERDIKFSTSEYICCKIINMQSDEPKLKNRNIGLTDSIFIDEEYLVYIIVEFITEV